MNEKLKTGPLGFHLKGSSKCHCGEKLSMTETHSLGDWEQRFEELPLAIAYKQNGIKIIDFDYLKDQIEEIIKPFIKELLLAQKEGFRREIEGLKKETEPQNFPSGNGLDYAIARSKWQSKFEQITGYNEALYDLLTKLDTNGI